MTPKEPKMATTRVCTRDMMVAILAGTHPTATVAVDEITLCTRFATNHTLVWREGEGPFWRCHYTVGSTETQDYAPWEGQITVESVLVRHQLVQVLTYVEVDGGPNHPVPNRAVAEEREAVCKWLEAHGPATIQAQLARQIAQGDHRPEERSKRHF